MSAMDAVDSSPRSGWIPALFGAAVLPFALWWYTEGPVRAFTPPRGAVTAPAAPAAPAPNDQNGAAVAARTVAPGAATEDGIAVTVGPLPAVRATAEPDEDDRYRALLAEIERDPDGFARSARARLASATARSERLALLRAAWDGSSTVAADLFVDALQTLPDEPARLISVPAFAARLLAERARADARARSALRDAVWSGRGGMAPRLRRVSAARLVALAGDAELTELAAFAAAEGDPETLRSMEAAAAGRSDAAHALSLLGLRAEPQLTLPTTESPW